MAVFTRVVTRLSHNS